MKCFISVGVLLSVASIACAASLTPYILGGKNAVEGQFPFMVSVQDSDDYSHICGGSILNKRWVLTAAHCIYELQPIDLLVRAGTVMVGRDYGTRYFVEERIVHKDFTFESKANDIALIKIEREFDFSSPLMKPVKLSTEYLAPEKEVTSLGWGMYDLQSWEWPQILQFLNAKSTSNQICKILQNIDIRDTETCFYREAEDGICQGDGGGPLVIQGSNLQVGVGTYDKNCNTHNPRITKYTRVNSYIDWIYENTDSWDL